MNLELKGGHPQGGKQGHPQGGQQAALGVAASPFLGSQKKIWEISYLLFSQIWFLRCCWIQEKSETKNRTYSFVITNSSFFFLPLIFNPLEIEQYKLHKWIPCQKSL